ncbi:hypothetical protein HA402_010727 [Bradysia odoriphaga]|nr:hypothetical protein HA402_010727 [Bradysia odoriphaga]
MSTRRIGRSNPHRSRSASPDQSHQSVRTRSRSRHNSVSSTTSPSRPSSSQDVNETQRSRDRRIRSDVSSTTGGHRLVRQTRTRLRPSSPRRLPASWDQDLSNYLAFMRNQSSQGPVENRSRSRSQRQSGSDNDDDQGS